MILNSYKSKGKNIHLNDDQLNVLIFFINIDWSES